MLSATALVVTADGKRQAAEKNFDLLSVEEQVAIGRKLSGDMASDRVTAPFRIMFLIIIGFVLGSIFMANS